MIASDPNSTDVPTSEQIARLRDWLFSTRTAARWSQFDERVLAVPVYLRWRGYHVEAMRMLNEDAYIRQKTAEGLPND